MSAADRFTFRSDMYEYAGSGALLGFCHGIAETFVLGSYGVLLSRPDVLLLLLLYPLLGALAGTALRLAVVPFVHMIAPRHITVNSSSRWLLFLLPAVWVYAIVGIRQAWTHSTVGIAMLASLIIPSAALILSVRFRRTSPRSLNCFAAFLALSFVIYSSSLVAHDYSIIEPLRRTMFIGAWAILIALCFVTLLAVRSRVEVTGARSVSFFIAVPIAAVLAIAPWFMPFPLTVKWHVRTGRQPVAPSEQQPRPNVILIVVDTVRADHIELFGYERETMPKLTKRARRDFDVAQAIMATASSSLPSHGSMFTGLYSSSHGGHYPFLDDPNPPPYSYFMRDDVPTLAEWLRGQGYSTVGISANFGVLSSFGLDRGFVDYDARSGPWFRAKHLSWLRAVMIRSRSFDNVVLRRVLPAKLERHLMAFNPHEPPYRRAGEISDLAKDWLGAHSHQPFFMFLNYFDAHLPYVPVLEFDQAFAPRPDTVSWVGFPDDHERIAKGVRSVLPEELAYLRGQYDAELLYLDRELEFLFQDFENRQFYDDSLIIIVSDHGEGFLEHGFLRHGVTLYESEVSVPLLIKLPASSQETAPQSLPHFQFIDLLPTVTKVLGIEAPHSIQGTPWAAGRDYAIAENFCLFRDIEPLGRELFGVRIGNWKYIASTEGTEEAYDIAADPGETNNLFGEHPDKEDRARRIHAEHLSTYHQRPTSGGVGDSMLERLRALGYVD